MKKKYLIRLVVMLSAAFLLIMSSGAAKAVIYSSLDQTCDLASEADSKVSLIVGGGSQYFTPTLNRLTKVVVKINGDGAGTLMATIIADTDYLGFSDTIAEPDGLNKIVTFRFDSLALTPGTQYRLAILATYGNDFAQWQYKNACYAGGDALVSGRFQAYDFIFATYGYNEEPPVETTEDGGAADGGSPESGASPEANNQPLAEASENNVANNDSSPEPAVQEAPIAQAPSADIKINQPGQAQRTSTIEPPNDLIGRSEISQINLSGDDDVLSSSQMAFIYISGLIVLILLGYLVYRTIRYYRGRIK